MVDLGIYGKLKPIGIIEAIQNISESCCTYEVVSHEVEILKIKADVFVKCVQNNANVWNELLASSEHL